MEIYKKIFTKNNLLIAYKLLHDALFLALLTFVAILVADGLLANIVSVYVSFAQIAIVIMLLLGGIIMLGKKLEITYVAPKFKKNRLLPILVTFLFLLVGNSLLKFALWENLLITLATILVGFLFYERLFKQAE